MADRTASTTDAAKRRAVSLDEAAANVTAASKAIRDAAKWIDLFGIDPTYPTAQEPDMTAKDRHDELVALLNKISEESVTASNVLADMLDLLRERLPERAEVKVAPFDPDLIETPGMGSITRNLAAFKHEAETPMREHGECCEAEAERDALRERLRMTREVIGRLADYFQHHTADAISPHLVARRIKWCIEESGIDDERAAKGERR